MQSLLFLLVLLCASTVSVVLADLFKASPTVTMPCCHESIGYSACQDMKNKRPKHFAERCSTDPDFGMVQCCRSCNTNVSELGRILFAGGTKSRHCFDRQNKKFCHQFLYQMGMYAGNQGQAIACNGDSAPLAFRICRRTCGFCELSLYEDARQNGHCPQWNATRISFNAPPVW